MNTNFRQRIILITIIMMIGMSACTPKNPMTETSEPSPISTQITPSLPDNAVEVWVTYPDQSKKLSREANQIFQAGENSGNDTIVVQEDLLYQRMEGFGAAMTDSSAWLIMNALNEEARLQLMKDLFTREGNGIGLSYVRIPLGASDFALKDYTYDDMSPGQQDPKLRRFNIEYDKAYILPALRLATELNPQVRFMGSPWSAPAWMKGGASLHGGTLMPEFYEAFANYHVAFIQAYENEGVTIDTITPQNEPMHSSGGYPTMLVSAKGAQELVRDYLGPAFKQAGLSTRILIFDHNWDLVDYPLEVLNDPAAAAFVDGVAFHCYGGDVSAQSVVHLAHPDKSTWFTECSGGGWATDFGDNLSWNLRNLVVGNFRNWGNSVLLWNLALDENDGPQNGGCGDCRGVVTINQSTGEITYNEEYYILGHVSKFVDPGAYRIESVSSDSPTLNHVAFLNPDGSMVVLVQSDAAATFDVSWNDQHFTYSLPAKGAVTFKWYPNVRPGPTVTPMPTSEAKPTATLSGPGITPATSLLLDFETDTDFYVVSNTEVSLDALAYQGTKSLRLSSTSGNWHVGGVLLGAQPLDLTASQKLCFWVMDTTAYNDGKADNTVGVRLRDGSGGNQEVWTDHAETGINPKTVKDQWVQMCIDLVAFSMVDLTRVTKIEFNAYWAGDWYFDDISLQP